MVSATPERIALAKDDRRDRVIERMRARAWPVPGDYVFDREEVNAR
ncbi:MAG: hypothetical protein OXL36_17465 [Bryobacterales bacterium]|nr:hypothetical protein [Bryobacterales bacterium]MDE0295247.1 hypothetical protein [Bryobacterales bacterium]